MADFFNKFKEIMRLPSEDELDQLEEQESRQKPKSRERVAATTTSGERTDTKSASSYTERKSAANGYASETTSTAPAAPRAKHTASNYGSSTYIENRGNSKAIRMVRPDGSKVIPINTMKSGFEVCIMKPQSFEDSQDICDVLLSERAAIVNLEGLDNDLAQRIMDFISGSIYSINGKLYQISGYIFIVTCESVDISGDYDEILAQSGFDVPKFK